MEHAHKVDVPLTHHVEVSRAVQLLLQHLQCDHWYIACQREHLFIYHFTKAGMDHYAACFQCNPPVDKGIYHGSKAWALSLIPLSAGETVSQDELHRLSTGLASLA
jgi:hypothetical protein